MTLLSKESHYQSIGLLRIIDIAKKLNLHKDTVAYRIKAIGIIATDRWWYDEYQIELIKDFERTPKVKEEVFESKINGLCRKEQRI